MMLPTSPSWRRFRRRETTSHYELIRPAGSRRAPKIHQHHGQIYSIIVDSDGEVLAGKHREGAGATKRHGIDTEDLAKKIGVSRVSAKQLIIMHSNVQRQVSKEETRAGLLKLANGFGVQGFPKEKIAAEIAKWVPYTPQYIRELLPDEYKQESKAREFAKPVSQTRAPEPLP